jgi:hypothetical protein
MKLFLRVCAGAIISGAIGTFLSVNINSQLERNKAYSFIIREHGLSDSTKTLAEIGGIYNPNRIFRLADSIIKAKP